MRAQSKKYNRDCGNTLKRTAGMAGSWAEDGIKNGSLKNVTPLDGI